MRGDAHGAGGLRLHNHRLAWILGSRLLAPTGALLLVLAPPGHTTPQTDAFLARPPELFRTAGSEGALVGRRVAVPWRRAHGEYVLAPPPMTGPRPVVAVSWPDERAISSLALSAGLADAGQLLQSVDLRYLAPAPVSEPDLRARARSLRECLGDDVVVAPELDPRAFARALATAVWRVRGAGPHDPDVDLAAAGVPAGWNALADRGLVAMPTTPELAWRTGCTGYPERWSRRFAGGVLGLIYGPPWTAQLEEHEWIATDFLQAVASVELAACLAGLRDPAGAWEVGVS